MKSTAIKISWGALLLLAASCAANNPKADVSPDLLTEINRIRAVDNQSIVCIRGLRQGISPECRRVSFMFDLGSFGHKLPKGHPPGKQAGCDWSYRRRDSEKTGTGHGRRCHRRRDNHPFRRQRSLKCKDPGRNYRKDSIGSNRGYPENQGD